MPLIKQTAGAMLDVLRDPARDARSAEHEKMSKAYSRKITRLKANCKKAPSLAEVIELKSEIKATEEQLRTHRLNYHEFVLEAAE